MSRLYDQVLARGKRADGGGGHYCIDVPEEVLEDATVVWGENAAAYFHTTADKRWDLAEDFPVLAPLFKNFFVEYKAPRGDEGPQTVALGDWEVPLWKPKLRESPGVRAQGPENSPFGFGSRWGFLFATVDLWRESREGVGPELTVMEENSPERLRGTVASNARAAGYRWLVDVVNFLGDGSHAPIGPWFWWRITLDENGRIGVFPDGSGPSVRATYAAPDAGFGGNFRGYEFAAMISGMLLPALFTVSLMNCKNVSLTSEAPAEKLSRRHRKKHGRPLCRYHLLELDPMKSVLDTEGAASEDGLKKALHICRGHFKTYGPENRLFGKHEGTYWWPQHARGSGKRGGLHRIVLFDSAALAAGTSGNAAGTREQREAGPAVSTPEHTVKGGAGSAPVSGEKGARRGRLRRLLGKFRGEG